MRIALLQHDIVWEDPRANHARLAPQITVAASTGARLVMLTELFATGFSMATDRIAEPVGGPTSRFLSEQAATHGVWVCGSVAERPEGADRPFNQLVLAGPDGMVHRYAKIHPFTFSGEHEHYAAGRDRVTVDIEGVRTSLFVCYDLRFADEFWAVAPDTDLYVIVANWPAARRRHWQALLAARAIENQAYVAAVNRIGEGNGLEYAGDSQVVDPMGEILASAAGIETVLVADVDPAIVTDVRARFPFLADRRS